MKDTFVSGVKDYKLQSNVKIQIAECLKKYEGKRITIEIERLKSKRSSSQNNFYWGGYIQSQIDCFKERWGELFDKEQVHAWNLTNIWYIEVVNKQTGEVEKMPGSSKTKTKMEFEERMEKGRQFFWNKFDWHIPKPGEQLTIT